MNELRAVPIVQSEVLVGTKKAVRMNGNIYVSPAMFELLIHANDREMLALQKAIEIVDVGNFDFLSLPNAGPGATFP